jgi:hypothetical protein
MRQIRAQTIVLCALLAAASEPAGSQAKLDLQNFFAKNIGLSQEQITAIGNGEPVALDLKPRIPDEIFVFGAIYINADPESYVKFAGDLDRLRKLSEYLAVGQFTNPPRVSDLEGFTLDEEDITALKKCKPNDCDVQIAAGSMEHFQKAIDWSAPNPEPQVNQFLQNAVVQRLLAYQQKGNLVLGEYNDKDHPTVVSEHFKYMLSYAKALPDYLPGFYDYLLSYPNQKPAGVVDTFQWSKVKFGLKPTLRVLHISTMRGSGPNEPAYVVAEKQLYSSHYFETALDLTFCIRDRQDPKKTGFYLIKAMGSEQAGLTGFKGSLVRRIAVDRSVSSLEKSLAVIKGTLENHQ